MAKSGEKFEIRIESILGGHASSPFFASDDQYTWSHGIDPSLQVDLITTSKIGGPSGLLRPVALKNVGTTTVTNQVNWLAVDPKTATATVFVYASDGSVYTITNPQSPSTSTISGLGDLNDGGDASGNGMAYYDNYIYFARDTTIARYGPLDGTPAFIDDYWVGTLGLTALTDQTYPHPVESNNTPYPNHFLHRHSDGKLYIADVVGNQGTLHYVKTSKTTTEGDTNDGSTYNAVSVGYGLWPTSIESYGSDLAIAFFEAPNTTELGSSNERRTKPIKAKVAFWDTTTAKVDKITWVEFPDPYISAMKNVGGVLYVISGSPGNLGFRVSRFIGGYTFEEVAFIPVADLCFPGAVDARGKQLIFGTYSSMSPGGVVLSLGGRSSLFNDKIFGIGGASENEMVTAVLLPVVSAGDSYTLDGLITGLSGGGGTDTLSGAWDRTENVSFVAEWRSRYYMIGQRFKITKLRIPMASPMQANVNVSVDFVVDRPSNTTTHSLSSIDGSIDSHLVVRRCSVEGRLGFYLELAWDSTKGNPIATIGLPIIIEGELIDD